VRGLQPVPGIAEASDVRVERFQALSCAQGRHRLQLHPGWQQRSKRRTSSNRQAPGRLEDGMLLHGVSNRKPPDALLDSGACKPGACAGKGAAQDAAAAYRGGSTAPATTRWW
jgi:hypothetical protein